MSATSTDARSTSHADVVVIGAGIIGASCAYRLAQRGLRVAVVEAADSVASGSTGRSFASVRVQWSEAVNIELSWRSIQFYRDFERHLGDTAGYQPTGYLLLFPEEQWETHLEVVELQRAHGVPVSVLDLAEATRLTPFETTGLGGATWGSADGAVDPHQITSTFISAARRHGAALHLRQPVTGIKSVGDLWRVRTTDFEFEAPTIVNAAGGWSGEVGRLADLDVPVHHVRRNVFSTTANPARPRRPMTVDVGSGVAMRSEGDRLLFTCAKLWEENGYNTRVDWPWMETVLESASERFPWLADEPLDRKGCWAGTYEVTPDHLPIIGWNPDAKGWVDASGFSGHGVMQAPEVGKLVAEEIVDGEAHSLDITPLRHARLRSAGEQSPVLVF